MFFEIGMKFTPGKVDMGCSMVPFSSSRKCEKCKNLIKTNNKIYACAFKGKQRGFLILLNLILSDQTSFLQKTALKNIKIGRSYHRFCFRARREIQARCRTGADVSISISNSIWASVMSSWPNVVY